MHIAEFSVKNSVLVNLLMGAIIVIGLIFALVLPLELFPSIKLDIVTVDTVFPGASAEDVEKLVTIPIEEEIKNTSGIKLLRSTSSEGLSVVIAELESGEDASRFVQDIDSKISRIKDRLPEDAEEPIVEEVKSDFPLLNIAITGEVPRQTLRNHAIRLKDELQLIDGVDNIVFSGIGDPIFWVNLDYPKMHQYKINIDQVSNAIIQKNLDLPGGGYTQDKIELLVRTRGKIYEVDDILNIPIIRDPSGKHVLIRDIASVEIGEEKTRTSSRVNGEPAITFWINKQKNVDAIDTVAAIREYISEYKNTLPESINIYDTNDSSYWVKKRFQSMLKSGGLGLFFVMLSLGLFLNRRAALIAALGIPISFLGAFILMKFNGITINMLSMFGLIMVLGIVVDDAIIVVENVQRYITQGVPPREAAIRGTKEVALPVMATILTNIAAFIPLLFATGLIGEFLSVIPKVAIFALLVSLLEALLIMPSHCADWLKPETKNGENKRRWFFVVRSVYLKGLYFSLRNRYVVVLSFVFILFLSFFIIIGLPNVMFYQHDTSEFQIRVENPSQSSLEYTKSSVKKIEEVVKQVVPEHALKNIVSMVGIDLTTGDSPGFGDHLATIIVEYEDFENREENGLELKKQVRENVEKIVVGPEKLDFIAEAGIPTGKPVDVRILGNNIDTLKEISQKVQNELNRYSGVYGISDNLIWGKPEIRVKVDERKAAIFGLDTTTVAKEVRALVDGLTVAQTRIGKEEADINVKYDIPSENLFNLIQSHQILTPGKERVAIGTIADIEMSPSILDIKRYDSNRSVSVRAEVDQKITTSREVNTKITGYVEEVVSNYPGYHYKLAGEEEDYRKTMDDIMRASIAAIILIYLILASILRSYFQPLIIMSILPFTLIGVTAGILLRGEPRTLPAIIGIVALFGIVVNDSLVLMDFINKRKDKFNNRIFAVVMSAKHRFRPIILTTLTTCAGLSTLMFAFRGEAAFLAPMATALGVGLLFSTIIL
ncbi:MAG: efflux RND transporter permease subunit, partial [Thermodesulfobacteriota bacterium]